MGDLKEKYLQLWGRLTKKQHYMAIGGVVLLLIVILAASFSLGSKPDMVASPLIVIPCSSQSCSILLRTAVTVFIAHSPLHD